MQLKKTKDLRKRILLLNKENSRICYKFLLNSFSFKEKKLNKYILENTFKLKNYSKTKIIRRCIFTNRSRSSIRPYNISRVKFRQLLQYGMIPGFKKTS